jgi:4-amino-4-deoxy-L-arabinose transferase-like glycosyltransferase
MQSPAHDFTAGTFALTDRTKKLLWWSLGFMFIARVICSVVVPLTDTTEARYGEIARKMLETGNWVTPLHDYEVDRATCEKIFCVELDGHNYGEPFWAKPPLSTWLAAFSMKLFGVNEFAARLPSALLGIGMLLLVWHWCAARRNRDFALATCAALAGMSLFFMAGGAVMTDSSLAFCTTLTMISFWRALHTEKNADAENKNTLWGYLFFVGLGIGLLAKGPLVGVLTFLPILPWLIFCNNGGLRKNWLSVWRALPWIRGTLLMLMIGAPWYIIAEHKTPGFLAYFILGEHFGRFLNAGWSGDKYGHAHAEPLGMIWVFWLMSALPWSFVFIAKLKTLFGGTRKSSSAGDGWISYLALWSFMPIAFFTFAHNIIWPYPLPTLPALAVLTMELLARGNAVNSSAMDIRPLGARLAAINFFSPVILLIVAMLYAFGNHDLLKSSQKDTALYYLQARPSADSGLYYYRRRYYSGEFYSAGRAKMIERDRVGDLIGNGHTDFLVIYADDLQKLQPELRAHFEPVKTFGEFVMLRENTAETGASPSAS